MSQPRRAPGLPIAALGFLLIALTGTARLALGQNPTEEGFEDHLVFDGLNSPTAARFAPDGRIFIAEKSGRLLVFSDLEDDAPTLVADLSTNVYDAWDRGLLGLAIHPDFPTEPWIYVLYTFDAAIGGTPPTWGDTCPDPPGFTRDGCVVSGRVSRLRIDGDQMVGQEEVLIEAWCQQFPSHSIGDLHFGLDGALYVSAGDGASFNGVDYGQIGNACNDPVQEGGAMRSQDVRSEGDGVGLHGSILRIDPSTGEALPDNPLYGGADLDDDRVIAFGLRNPFRFTVDPRDNRLFVGDVGWSTWEEIDIVADPLDGTVENFGWPCFEGDPAQPGYDQANLPLCESLYASGTATAPLHAYDHRGSRAITGLAVYTGESYPSELHGALFFADYSGRFIRVIPEDENGQLDPSAWRTFHTGARTVDLQTGPGGDLFYVEIATGQFRQIRYFPVNHPPRAVVETDQRFGASPLTITFDGSGSSDPDEDEGDFLTFDWDLDGDGIFGDSSEEIPVWVYEQSGAFDVRLRVSDSGDLVDETSVEVTVDDSPPRIDLLKPDGSELWSAGDPIDFAASGIDPDLGPLAEDAFDWTLVLLHCTDEDPDHDCHDHVIEHVEGSADGKFIAPDHEYPSYLELRVEGRDAGPPDWWNRDWRWRRRLFFEAEDLATNVFDVPVLVRLDPSRLDYGQSAPFGSDLRFTDIDGQPLPHEIESWQEGGVSEIWVEVPRIEAGNRWGHVWMYWGNQAAESTEDPVALWDGEHRGVWHMGADLTDSTGRPQGLLSAGTQTVAGRIGEAQWLDGASAYLQTPSSDALSVSGQVSIEAWIRLDDPGVDRDLVIVSKKSTLDGNRGFALVLNPAQGRMRLYGGGNDFAEMAFVPTAGWHHLAATAVGFVGRLYVDGQQQPRDILVSNVTSGTDPLAIGRLNAATGGYFPGVIDEVRIDGISRTSDWVTIQYRSMSDQLLRFGPVQSGSGLAVEVHRELHPRTVTLSLQTEPAGLELVMAGRSFQTPVERQMIRMGRTTVSAPLEQTVSGRRYRFIGWTDGGPAAREVFGSKDRALRARYLLIDGAPVRGQASGLKPGK
ncbi:MAG: DUF2341 domain-containing protein [Planctomycetota bacterium]